MKRRKQTGALVALAVVGTLFVPGSAKAAETFTIEVGQGFFEEGLPGFSARMYPGHIKVHSGDTIVFNNNGAALFAESTYPQEWFGDNFTQFGDPFFFLLRDPDDGERALKFNEASFATAECGAADNPCVWTGKEDEFFLPTAGEDGLVHVRVEAAQGETLWAASSPGTDIGGNLRVDVVGPQETASTQEELDARAAELKAKDREDAFALHSRMNSKRTSHVTASGQKVYDVFVGATGGPISIFAMYPKRIRVPLGARVQYHFMEEVEPHTATFGGPKARDLARNGFVPVCDPDGDEGTSPDLPASFSETEPPCADMSQFEVDVDERIVYETGNRRVTGNRDLENSGLKVPVFPDEQTFDANPWTVKMADRSSDKGFFYFCLVHGPSMGGRVVVK
ncbi:MAG: hypothetical protein M3N53_04025 [Actinomycetota bacterium]|nr:hypothetical protein [Actinomycetota bacterium]